MKYALNKIKIRFFTQQVGWLGGKGMNSILGVQGSSYTNDMCCAQHWNIDQICCI
jgi:hypothetical protein